MLDSDTKKFINDIVIGAADELRLILTDFHQGLREMHEELIEELDGISSAINGLEDRLSEMNVGE